MDPELTQVVIDRTRRWVERVVVGLDLCPFARPVLRSDGLRYAVDAGEDPDGVVDAVATELRRMMAQDIPTTLLIVPRMLGDFLDFNDAIDLAEACVDALGLRGVIQVATFHPHYRFGGVPEDDVSNYTNRSPYPMFHLLREADVSDAVARHPDTARIPDANIRRLEGLGLAAIRALGGLDDAGEPPAT